MTWYTVSVFSDRQKAVRRDWVHRVNVSHSDKRAHVLRSLERSQGE